jgi:hypothetical protein
MAGSLPECKREIFKNFLRKPPQTSNHSKGEKAHWAAIGVTCGCWALRIPPGQSGLARFEGCF